MFKSHENPAKETISIQNEVCTVLISYTDNLEFAIKFQFRSTLHLKTFPPLNSKEKLFFKEDIVFDTMDLHPIEKEKLANRLNDILDYIFG